MNQQFNFGFPEEWEAFQRRNGRFLPQYDILHNALKKVFDRTANTQSAADRVIFFLGQLCVDNFHEILLLAANGYGGAAYSILRGLYERAVTIAYLSKNPDEASRFVNYFFVSQRKLILELKCIGIETAIPEAERKKIEEEYQKVKDNYQVADCKRCGTTRTNHTWSKLDFVSMAKKTPLAKSLGPSYYLPLMHAHSTVAGLLTRIEESPSSGPAFNSGPQTKEADMALLSAHKAILDVLRTQIEYFNLEEFRADLQQAEANFIDIWSEKSESSGCGCGCPMSRL